MTATMPAEPELDLRELWEAAFGDGAVATRPHHHFGALLLCLGLFLEGIGLGAMYRTMPSPPTMPSVSHLIERLPNLHR